MGFLFVVVLGDPRRLGRLKEWVQQPDFAPAQHRTGSQLRPQGSAETKCREDVPVPRRPLVDLCNKVMPTVFISGLNHFVSVCPKYSRQSSLARLLSQPQVSFAAGMASYFYARSRQIASYSSSRINNHPEDTCALSALTAMVPFLLKWGAGAASAPRTPCVEPFLSRTEKDPLFPTAFTTTTLRLGDNENEELKTNPRGRHRPEYETHHRGCAEGS